jgi:cobyrinic acid a,c-diamide synthase
MGANLIEISAISQEAFPRLDALYIGGGFPEVQAQALADNQAFRSALKSEIENGLPVYAECGGFMYMGEHLLLDGRTYPMVGALPVEFVLQKKPQGHGYTIMEVARPNPYYPVGEILKGHEFHYSKAVLTKNGHTEFLFKVTRGHGVDGHRDGMCRKNLLATYTHVHAVGCPLWAKSLFREAQKYRQEMTGSEQKVFIKCEKKS